MPDVVLDHAVPTHVRSLNSRASEPLPIRLRCEVRVPRHRSGGAGWQRRLLRPLPPRQVQAAASRAVVNAPVTDNESVMSQRSSRDSTPRRRKGTTGFFPAQLHFFSSRAGAGRTTAESADGAVTGRDVPPTDVSAVGGGRRSFHKVMPQRVYWPAGNRQETVVSRRVMNASIQVAGCGRGCREAGRVGHRLARRP